MVVVLRSSGDLESVDARYQTFVGKDIDNLSVVYDQFICHRPIKGVDFCHLIKRSIGNNCGYYFGDAGIANNILEATVKLYQRAWVDSMDLRNDFIDETGFDGKYARDEFGEVLRLGFSRGESPLASELSELRT